MSLRYFHIGVVVCNLLLHLVYILDILLWWPNYLGNLLFWVAKWIYDLFCFTYCGERRDKIIEKWEDTISQRLNVIEKYGDFNFNCVAINMTCYCKVSMRSYRRMVVGYYIFSKIGSYICWTNYENASNLQFCCVAKL